MFKTEKSIDLGQYIWKKMTDGENNVNVATCKEQDNEIGLAKEAKLKKVMPI